MLIVELAPRRQDFDVYGSNFFPSDFESPRSFFLAPAPQRQGSVSNEREEPAGCGNQEGFSTVSVILSFTPETPSFYPVGIIRLCAFVLTASPEIVETWKRTTSLSRRAI